MTHKKTILFVYHSLNIGGTEKELLAYITHLPANRYDIHLALTYIRGELQNDLPKYVSVHHVPGDSIQPDIFYLYNLYQTIRQLRPDIVVGFMQDINFNILFLRWFTNLRYKTIASEQIILSEWQRLQHTLWLKRKLVTLLYRRADICVGQSRPILIDLTQNFGVNKQKVFLIPNYVTPPVFKQAAPKIQPPHPYFLYVGRLAPEKNIELLLHAFARVIHIDKAVDLVIVGPHKRTQYAQLCRQLDIENRVIFTGYVENPGPYYKQAIALVIPSSVEGRSRTMIEAMLAGCPVISSNFVGHDEYIKNGVDGLVFDKISSTQLSKHMEFALQHKSQLKLFGNRARKRVSNLYKPIFYTQYTRLLSQCIAMTLRTSL